MNGIVTLHTSFLFNILLSWRTEAACSQTKKYFNIIKEKVGSCSASILCQYEVRQHLKPILILKAKAKADSCACKCTNAKKLSRVPHNEIPLQNLLTLFSSQSPLLNHQLHYCILLLSTSPCFPFSIQKRLQQKIISCYTGLIPACHSAPPVCCVKIATTFTGNTLTQVS